MKGLTKAACLSLLAAGSALAWNGEQSARPVAKPSSKMIMTAVAAAEREAATVNRAAPCMLPLARKPRS